MAASDAGLSPVLESPSTSIQREAPHLLYKTGAYFLKLADKAHSKAPKLPWPFGSLTQCLASLPSPVVQSMQHEWLALLYFIDEQILTVQDVVRFFFPPSSHVFEAINTLGDELLEFFVKMTESSMDYFPSIVTFTLSFLTSVLPACMRDHQTKEENIAPVPEETEPTQVDDGEEVQFVDKFVGVDETRDSGVERGEEDVLESERGKNEEDCKIGMEKEKEVPVEVHGLESQPSSDAATVGKAHVGVAADQGITVDPVLRLFGSKWIQM